LLHFLLLGALIFLVYGWVSDERRADEIFISAGQQDNLINTFARTWQRPPTAVEFKGLLDDYVREEIAYREGRVMGLDENDVIIRRRLRQKLELLAEDVASLSAPVDADLQAFLDANVEDYLIEPRFSFQQIYFSTDRREDAAADATQQLAELQSTAETVDFSVLGDPIALPGRIENARLDEIARLFGSNFSEQLQAAGTEQATGLWIGPLQSGFGLHLVRIIAEVPGSKPDLEQVRESVQRDWFSIKRREAVDGMYQRLAENFSIEIEPPVTELAAESSPDEAAAQ
jgi:hypothetical protein